MGLLRAFVGISTTIFLLVLLLGQIDALRHHHRHHRQGAHDSASSTFPRLEENLPELSRTRVHDTAQPSNKHHTHSRVLDTDDEQMVRMVHLYLPKLREPEVVETKWRSQCHQDRIVSFLFEGQKGFFLDLGSSDALMLSNTYGLEKVNGWDGICWEAQERYWYDILNMRDCTLVGGAAGAKHSGDIVRFAEEKMYGGIVSDQADNKEETENTKSIPASSVTDVFLATGAPRVIDYLSLDVEGAETIVMSSVDLDMFRFNVMTIERPKDDLREMLKRNGYILHPHDVSTFGETLWFHRDFRTAYIRDVVMKMTMEELLLAAGIPPEPLE